MTGPVLVPFDGAAFEQRAQPNGGVFWSARDFMVRLGYVSFPVFKNAINRAIGTCTTLGIPIGDNFVQAANVHGEPDYKLSRFACLLVAMNGDPRKPEVAAAQAYFATLAEATRLSFLSAQDVERVAVRDDISERERGLSSAAKRAGVDHYAFFQNEGYRGMYNMNLGALRDFKGLPDHRSPLDFMDKRELAGNLFRLTETEARLKGEGVIGQRPAERVAFAVGRKVRNMMIESDGKAPEDIPAADDIKDTRRRLKATAKEFKKLDRPALPPHSAP